MVIANKVVSFIGCGILGTSMVKGLLAGQHPPANIIATGRNLDKLSSLKSQGVRVTTNNLTAIAEADLVVLCVRPSQIAAVLEDVAAAINSKNPIVISVVAGLSIQDMAQKINCTLIRSMPNIAGSLGQGVTLFQVADNQYKVDKTNKSVDTDNTPEKIIKIAEEIFSPLGLVVQVATAAAMDSWTAVSGCGPAYFFYLVKILCDYGVARGLPRDQVQQAAVQTIKGAAALLEASPLSPEELINSVAVPGEKTATRQALNYMQSKGIEDIVQQGAAQAEARAAEMGREIGKQINRT